MQEVATTHVDASGPSSHGTSDAGVPVAPSGPDMANGTCTPQGDWTYTSAASGDCAAPAASYVYSFAGHLDDPYIADAACTTFWALVNGDCELDYTQTCGSEVRHGSITMTSPTTLRGSYTLSGPSNCTSQVTVTATKN